MSELSQAKDSRWGKPFVWTASCGSRDGRTLKCDWCGCMTDFLGSQMGAYKEIGFACRDCMRYGAPAEGGAS